MSRGLRRARRAAVVVLTSVALIASGSSAQTSAAAGRGPDPHGPGQQRGSADGLSHRVDKSATQAKGGTGRAPGKGKGQLKEFERDRRSVKPFATGPNRLAPFDERTRKRQRDKARARADVFTDDAGHTQQRVSTGRMNFRDAGGDWTPIDTNLESVGGRLRQKANDLDVQVASRADDEDLVRLGLADGRSVAQSLKGAANVKAQVEGSDATFVDALPETDVRLSTSTDGVKETLVLKSRQAPTKWTFPLTLRKLTVRINDVGDLEYVSTAGDVVAISPRPFMTDAEPDPETGEGRRSNQVRYELITVKDKPAVRVVADSDWIAQEGRKFPVEVDPPLVYPDTMDTYADNTTPGTNHGSESSMAMGTPNNGTRLARTYMDFRDVPVAPANVTVSSVKLDLFLTYVTDCSAQPFDVHTITSAWTGGGITTYSTSNPTLGSKLGTATPTVSTANACGNSPVDPNRGKWVSVSLTPSAFRNWAASGIYGLALKAPTNTGVTWKRFTSANVTALRPYLEITYANNAPGQVDERSVADERSLQPQFIAKGTDPDAFPRSGDLDYEFKVYTAPYNAAATPVAESGRVTVGNWRVPPGKLKWATDYVWTVQSYDGLDVGPATTALVAEPFTTAIPQPTVGATLSKAAGERGFDPNTGNLTNTAADAAVNSVGPSLGVERKYNSRDPRTTTAFGVGWSTQFDMTVAEVRDPVSPYPLIGAVVTHPDGHQERYARDAEGKFLPGEGFFATLTPVTGGYSLTDDSTTWTFTQAVAGQTGVYGVVSVRDGPGRALTYTRTGGLITKATTASGRALTFTWTTPAAGASAHLATVTTDRAVAGDANSAQKWTYTYSGDRLTKVCPPTSSTECTVYEYQTGSPYPTVMLDSAPHTWWRLGEPSGSTIAGDSIVDNQGRYPADYANVTLGATASAIANGGGKAADFNGTSSRVTLPRRPDWNVGTLSFSLWFKTTTADRVLLGWAEDPLTKATTTAGYIPGLYLGTDGKLRAQLSRNGDPTPITTPGAVTDGNWHNVVLTASGASTGGSGAVQTLYLDGTAVGSQARSAFYSKRTAVTLGAGFIGDLWPGQSRYSTTNATGYPSYFKGSIADFAVHDRTLRDTEVKAAWVAATAPTAALLTKVTTAGGRIASQATWDVYRGAVAGITDANGGIWGVGAPAILGSSTGLLGAVRTAKPLGYWRLGDTAATLAAEDSGDQVTYAPLSNVTLGRPGPFGAGDSTATEFNGTNSVITAPASIDIGNRNAATISLWFKTTATGRVLFGYSVDPVTNPTTPSGYVPALYIGTDGKLYGQFWHGTANPIVTTKTVNDDKWHQATIAGGGGKQTLYLDGVSVGERTGTIGIAGLPNNTIGAGFLGAGWPARPSTTNPTATFFSGSLAEVAVYDRPLTAAEVGAQWQAYSASTTTYPIKTIILTGPVAKPEDLTLPNAPKAIDRFDPEHTDRVLHHTDTSGAVTVYGYDERGYELSTTDPNGNSVITGRDARSNIVSRVVCQDEDAGTCSTEEWGYFPVSSDPKDPRNDQPISYQDPRGDDYTTTYSYEPPSGQQPTGEPTKVTGPDIAGPSEAEETTTLYTTADTPAADGGHPPVGLVASVTTRVSATQQAITRHTYYANGDLESTTDPLGLITRFTYDGLGRPATTTVVSDSYPAGVVTSQTFDALNRVVTSTDQPITDAVTGVVHTARTTTTYDADSRVTATTVSDLTGGDLPRTTTTGYDTRGRVASLTDPTGGIESYDYDLYGNRTKVTAPDNTVTVMTYSPEGRLLTTTLKDYAGDPTRPGPGDLVLESRAYDAAGRLASTTDAMGWTQQLTYFDTNLVATVTRLDGKGAKFVLESNSYDASGSMKSRLTNDGATRTDFAYDASGRLTTTTVDPEGLNRATTLDLDAQNHVAKTTRTGGGRTEVETNTWDVLGNQLTHTVGEGANARTTTWRRDQRGLVVAMTDPLGNTTTYVNDEAGRPITVVAPAVPTESGVEGVAPITLTPITRTGYNTFGDPVSAQDPNGNRTVTAYDGQGRPVSVTSPTYTPPGQAPITATSRTSYDAMGRVLQETDALERLTTSTWDQLGRKLTSTAPGGARTTFTYDSAGDVLSTTTPEGTRTESTWDFKGRKLTDTRIDRTLGSGDAAVLTTADIYGSGGWLAQERSPAGVTTAYAYNAAGERASMTDGAGNITKFSYDLAGRQMKVTRPDGTAATTDYDPVGNATGTADLDTDGTVLRTTSTTYDLDDRTVAAVDANGTSTTWTRDARGAVITQTEPVDDGQSIVTGYGQDPVGNLTRVTDGRGNAFRTTYNAWNLPESTIEPATPAHPNASDRSWVVGYDSLGRITRTQAPGGVITTSAYDERGNLVSQAGTGAEAPTGTRTFEYDLDNRLKKASTPAGTNTLTWNDRGLLTAANGPSGDATFAYDADGRTTVRDDAAGRTTSTWDAAGRLAALTDAATGTTQTRSYDSNSQPTTVRYGTGSAVRTWAYDKLHRLTEDALAAPGGAVQSKRTYGYDRNDNVTAETVTGAADAGTDSYVYDRADRLTSWTHDGATTAYGYDPAGNRISVAGPSGTATQSFDARNRLSTATEAGGTTTSTWTPRGTLAATSGAAIRAVTSDAFDQVATDTAPDPRGGGSGGGGSGGAATGPQAYTYDALARRVSAGPTGSGTGPSSTLRYSGNGHDLAADGTAKYALDPSGSLVGVVEGSTASLTWTDRHADVVAAYRPTDGGLTGSTAYDPWGEVTSHLGTVPGRAGYQSEWTDPGTGIVDMWHRGYDPSTATFGSRDPQAATAGTGSGSDARDAMSANRYAYGNDNPLNRIDPDGLASVCGTGLDSRKYCANSQSALNDLIAQDRFVGAQAHSALSARQADNVRQALADAKQENLERVFALIAMNAANADTHTALVIAKQIRWAQVTKLPRYLFDLVHARSVCEAPDGHGGNRPECKYGTRWAAVWQPQQCGSNWFTCVVDIVSWLTIIVGPEILVARVTTLAGAKIALRAAKIRELNISVWNKAVGAGQRDWKRLKTVAAKCANSFAPSTLVLLADGTTQRISQIQTGQKVLSTDPDTGKTTTGTVTAVLVHDDNDLLDLNLTMPDGTTGVLHATRSHQIWDDTAHRWVPADQLTIGHILRTPDGAVAQVSSHIPTPGTAPMWDLTVSPEHTFYVVGESAGGSAAAGGAVLVHNSGCPTFLDGEAWLGSFNVGKGELEVLAQVRHSGTTLHLDDLAVFAKGASKMQSQALGVDAVNAIKRQVLAQAKKQGFKKVVVSYTRFLKDGTRRPGKLTFEVG